MTEEKKQDLAARIMAEIQPEIDRLIEERDAIVSAVVGTIGGTVEGRPTNRLNYLQRLRELVRIERDTIGVEPAQDDGKPEVKSIGGANTLDELMGLMEIARDNKTGITLDWVEVGILMRAAEVKRRIEEAR